MDSKNKEAVLAPAFSSQANQGDRQQRKMQVPNDHSSLVTDFGILDQLLAMLGGILWEICPQYRASPSQGKFGVMSILIGMLDVLETGDIGLLIVVYHFGCLS